jgi:hypothetical protein
MMNASDIATGALSEALEVMAFACTGPVDDKTVAPDVPVLTEMRFAGPKNGAIRILSGLALGRVLAGNIGCLAEIDDRAALDAWKEVCNVTCGLVIPRIADSTAEVYDVTVPDVKTGMQAPPWEPFVSQPGSRILNVEGYAAAVGLVVDDPSPSRSTES